MCNGLVKLKVAWSFPWPGRMLTGVARRDEAEGHPAGHHAAGPRPVQVGSWFIPLVRRAILVSPPTVQRVTHVPAHIGTSGGCATLPWLKPISDILLHKRRQGTASA